MPKTVAAKALTLRDVVGAACDGVFDAATQRQRIDKALKAMPDFHGVVWNEGIDAIAARFRYDYRAAVKTNRCPRGPKIIHLAAQPVERLLLDEYHFGDGRCPGDVPGWKASTAWAP